MSLLTFVNLPDVRVQLNRILPEYERNLHVPRVVHPLTNDTGIRRTIGTAFDYAFRIELERRNGKVSQRSWIAEESLRALQHMSAARPRNRSYRVLLQRVERAVREAKAFTKRYVRSASPRPATRLKLAAHAFRLARLDAIYRALRFDKLFVRPRKSDLEEIVAMLQAVPWEVFRARTTHLNPTFGEFSVAVGGADADVITGDMLLDIKVKQDAHIEKPDIRQVVGYLLLARAARRSGHRLPELSRIGIYFARHAHLWTTSVSEMRARPDFAEVEAAFIERVCRHARELQEARYASVVRLSSLHRSRRSRRGVDGLRR